MSYKKLSDFDYDLPDDLIATHPAEPRDHSRLLALDKKTGKIEHKHFYDIIDYLEAGDVLVLNNSKVIPARLMATKKETGGKVEVLLHKKLAENIWQCLLGGKVHEGLNLEFAETHPASRGASHPSQEGNLSAEALKNNHDGTWDLKFNKSGAALMKAIEKNGQMPLPPYIVKQREKESSSRNLGEKSLKVCAAEKSSRDSSSSLGMTKRGNDVSDYQTVFASDKKSGSVAAPTAGLHFTPELLKKIKDKGVKIIEITLYVGMGTFAPVKTEDISKHKMHAEWVEISKSSIINLQSSIKKNKRIIAVGTTSCRSLEACFGNLPSKGKDFKAWVDIFITPGYKFKIVDALITNFHLPKSTLLMLVSALAGKKNIDRAYAEAIKKKYRFYSYGDAMLIK
jgi:S-adenosylmethionine:tRNA ribosyltransferase-isomerase